MTLLSARSERSSDIIFVGKQRGESTNKVGFYQYDDEEELRTHTSKTAMDFHLH